jgi:hypothetical protein
MNFRNILFIPFLIFYAVHVDAQERGIAGCGNEIENPFFNVELNKELLQNNRTNGSNGIVYKIPVVFHVLTDDPTGVSNISDCIIRNQVDILNNCFRRKSGAPNTSSLGADAEIEFYLARLDPDTLPTTGIIRKTTTNCNYLTVNPTSAQQIQNQSKWPINRYLNIWVLKTMPNNNRTRGQAWAGSTIMGVFVHYSYVGSKNSGCPNLSYLDITGFGAYDLGMTVVHEVGHYLSLKHTFENCSPGDGCDDTPAVSGFPKAFCGSNNDTAGVCLTETRKRMWQNYLDYTDDLCMDRFTVCQVGKMRSYLTTTINYSNLITNGNFLATGGNITTSVNEISVNVGKTLQLYPNPFSTSITVLLKNPLAPKQFRIINMFGQEVKRGVISSGTQSIELINVPKGIYFLEYQREIYKLIKQ